MPIRTADEYRAALARLDQERTILASRSFTDDEQRDFEALVRDIEVYKAGGSVSGPTTAPTSAPPNTLLADNMRARVASSDSMHREIARVGLTPTEPPTSASRASWREVVDQQNLRASNPHAAKPPGVDVLRAGTAAASSASMEREIRRAGMVPVR